MDPFHLACADEKELALLLRFASITHNQQKQFRQGRKRKNMPWKKRSVRDGQGRAGLIQSQTVNVHNITDKDAFIFGFPYGFRLIQEEVIEEQLKGKGDLRFNEHIDNELTWDALIALLQVSFMLALQVKSTQLHWGHLYPATGLHLLPFCLSTNCTVWP